MASIDESDWDYIYGVDAIDYLYGLDTPDYIYSYGGDDYVYSGYGDDWPMAVARYLQRLWQ